MIAIKKVYLFYINRNLPLFHCHTHSPAALLTWFLVPRYYVACAEDVFAFVELLVMFADDDADDCDGACALDDAVRIYRFVC